MAPDLETVADPTTAHRHQTQPLLTGIRPNHCSQASDPTTAHRHQTQPLLTGIRPNHCSQASAMLDVSDWRSSRTLAIGPSCSCRFFSSLNRPKLWMRFLWTLISSSCRATISNINGRFCRKVAMHWSWTLVTITYCELIDVLIACMTSLGSDKDWLLSV